MKEERTLRFVLSQTWLSLTRIGLYRIQSHSLDREQNNFIIRSIVYCLYYIHLHVYTGTYSYIVASGSRGQPAS